MTFQVQRIDGELVHTDPKTDTAGRIVFLPPAVQVALRAQKARQAAERLAAGTKWRRTDERGDGEQLVFTTAEGQPVSEQTAWWVLNKACRDAGVRHVGLHDLRRFYLSEVQDKVGMAAARLVAGHTDEKMTAGYVSVRDGLLARAAEAAQEAIG